MRRKDFLKNILSISLLSFLPFKLFSGTPIIKPNLVSNFTPELMSKFNYGMYIINNKVDVIANPDYAATVVWKLVYQFSRQTYKHSKYKYNYEHLPENGLCNILTDGWTYWVGSKQDLCDYLNNNPYGEKYRILTKAELDYILNHRKNTNQLVQNL